MRRGGERWRNFTVLLIIVASVYLCAFTAPSRDRVNRADSIFTLLGLPDSDDVTQTDDNSTRGSATV